ncbi:MAG: hypothetical protein M0Q93_04525 [Terrimicrobiaceae bacterium]|jgi:hypothetical protein|nr:hypothetical protein [Terrimicrobiaceae bacterium]
MGFTEGVSRRSHSAELRCAMHWRMDCVGKGTAASARRRAFFAGVITCRAVLLV